MKYRTFRNLVSVALFLAMGGTCYGCYARWQRSLTQDEFARRDAVARQEAEVHRRQQAVKHVDVNSGAAGAPATNASGWLAAVGLREVDRDALRVLQSPVVDKIKDAAKGRPWKINVYADDGQRFNRLKIDLDRDEQDDETWTVFADDHIERKASSRDDGSFDQSYRLDMTGWVDMSPPASPPSSPPVSSLVSTPADVEALRPIDRDMLSLAEKLAPSAKVKDATKGKPYKINLYSDDGKRFGRAKVDLDRDDKWDESWTWKGEIVERKVSPADDENYTTTWVLSGESWMRR